MEFTPLRPSASNGQSDITPEQTDQTTVSSYSGATVKSSSLVTTTTEETKTNASNVSGHINGNIDSIKPSITSSYVSSETRLKSSKKTTTTYAMETTRIYINDTAVFPKSNRSSTSIFSNTITPGASVRMSSTRKFTASLPRTSPTDVTSDVMSTFSNDSTVSKWDSVNHTTTGFPEIALGTNKTSIGKDCVAMLSIVSAVSATIVIVVILTSVICMVRIRRKWRRKLREERLKTDIWTMSTFNNTIINENFADYTLAPTPMPSSKRESAKSKRNPQKTPRSSDGSRDLVQSWYSDGSQTNSLRRNTFSEPYAIGKGKDRAHRQMSEYSGDYPFVDAPYERGRTSTFSVGWNVKSRDRRVLMHYEEPVDKSSDDFRVLQFDTMTPRNDDIITEL